MPHSGPLDILRARLREQTAPRNIFPATVWGNPRAMTEVLKKIRRELGSEGVESINVDRVKVALVDFAKTHEVDNFVQLKYLCHGLLLPVGRNTWSLIDRDKLFDRLLAIVASRQVQAKQFRRCYQGFLGAYFALDIHSTAEGMRLQNWRTLRSFLVTYLSGIHSAAQRRGVVPDWLQALSDHKNLLGELPCKRYAVELVRGETAQLKAVCSGLGISSSSWVWTDALMAYVDHVCGYADRAFHAGLADVLKLVNGRSDLKLPEHLADRAIAKVVIRYSDCTDKPEHNELRDVCLHRIGNPWLDRTAWDARVGHEPARAMVEGWVKRRLIRDFFELLAHDGSADVRRLNYWLKWEPQITDMWFVLGSDAQRNQTAAFESVRKRMGTSARKLVDSDEQNNAFVMRIGPLLAIEFGMTGNACYIFAAAEFNSDLNHQWLDTKRELKQSNRRKWLPHQGHWEPKFDAALLALLRTVPASKGDLKFAQLTPKPAVATIAPSHAATEQVQAIRSFKEPASKDGLSSSALSGGPLLETDFEYIKSLCEELDIEWDDNRKAGGAFWVVGSNLAPYKALVETLRRVGFSSAASGKGYWYKRK